MSDVIVGGRLADGLTMGKKIELEELTIEAEPDWNYKSRGFYVARYCQTQGEIVVCPYQAVLSAVNRWNIEHSRLVYAEMHQHEEVETDTFCVVRYGQKVYQHMRFQKKRKQNGGFVYGFAVKGDIYTGMLLSSKRMAIDHAIWQHNEIRKFFEKKETSGRIFRAELLNIERDLKKLRELLEKVKE